MSNGVRSLLIRWSPCIAALVVLSACSAPGSSDRSPAAGQVPRLYSAFGNEPFWSVRIGPERIVFSRLGQQAPLVFGYKPPAASGGTLAFREVADGHDILVLLTAATCRDTMSGTEFAYEAHVFADGEPLAGCGQEGHDPPGEPVAQPGE